MHFPSTYQLLYYLILYLFTSLVPTLYLPTPVIPKPTYFPNTHPSTFTFLQQNSRNNKIVTWNDSVVNCQRLNICVDYCPDDANDARMNA